jgi:hypothetical protein
MNLAVMGKAYRARGNPLSRSTHGISRKRFFFPLIKKNRDSPPFILEVFSIKAR